MKRYYLSKIEQFEFEPGETAFRHRLQYAYPDVDKRFTASIAVDPVTGLPTASAVLCIIGAIDHAQFEADAALVAIPQVAPDIKVSATHTPTKNAFKTAAKSLGFADAAIESAVGNADGWGDVINYFGKLNDPAFNWKNFDLDES